MIVVDKQLCRVCSRPTPDDKRGRPHVFCSKKCSREYYSRRQKEYFKANPKMFLCVICGKEFKRNQAQVTCSDTCLAIREKEIRLEYNRNLYPRKSATCIICGKAFTGKLQTKTCSKECSNALNKRRAKQGVRHFYRKHSKTIKYRLKVALRQRIRRVIVRGSKFAPTFELTGCSRDFLMRWLEAQFERGMSWENYGERWVIDHKIPCAAFDLTKEEGQRSCFHYSNLRPLGLSENASKQAKIIPTQPELAIPIDIFKPGESQSVAITQL